MGRKRLARHRGLPANLYQNGPYFVYRRPDGKRVQVGKDMAAAVRAANVLNIKYSQGGEDLVARVESGGKTTNTVEVLTTRYELERVPRKKWGAKTRQNMIAYLQRYGALWGKRIVADISVRDVSSFLDGLSESAYPKHRTLLCDLFAFAAAKGLCEDNPAAQTLVEAPPERKRMRLTLEQFGEMHEAAEPWYKTALDIALLTLQRRADVVRMRFDDIKDGRLYVVQQKTKKHGSAAYLAMEMGDDLRRVIASARASGLISPFIIHRRPKRRIAWEGQEHWTQVRDEQLSKEWAETIERTSLAKLKPGLRPTFHEIRSLGAHLYENAGFPADYIQALLGHTSAKMTGTYLEGHGPKWTACAAGLKLPR